MRHAPLGRPPLRRQRKRLLVDVGDADLTKAVGHPLARLRIVRTAGDAAPVLLAAVAAAARDRGDRVELLPDARAVERRVRALVRWKRPPRKRRLEVVKLAERYEVAGE